MRTYFKYLILILIVSCYTLSTSNAQEITSSASSTSTSNTDCPKKYAEAQAELRDSTTLIAEEMIKTGIQKPQGPIAEFSCITDIWEDVKGYFGGLFQLGPIGGVGNMACDISQDVIDQADKTAQSLIKGVFKAAEKAVEGAVYGAIGGKGVVKDLVAPLKKNMKKLPYAKGNYNPLKDFTQPKIQSTKKAYKDYLYGYVPEKQN